ncbi:unnamed protein product [Nippostrongylus brasiliensis]|uniref:Fibronectin type-III domain-containing protein n=1 Tax=Nippostrongylus brasiliensis TaxID=27835 RepID=A0A0N4YJ19_NIPBR|nr:unnamed protein product [Nippostrongylus brasiliensis]
MATSYVTESLLGPASARGTSYTYTYESHYDNPPDVEDEEDRYAAVDDGSIHQTHKVSGQKLPSSALPVPITLDNLITRVTKVTTTRSVRQIPVGSPYADIYFDASGLPTPSPVVEVEAPLDELGIRLQKSGEEGRSAPPPAPPLGSKYTHTNEGEQDVPSAPSAPDVIGTAVGEVTLTWGAPLQKPGERSILGYQIELREFPDGDWERAHDQLLRDTTCTSWLFSDCLV